MKKQSRILALLFTMLLAVCLLAGCGGKSLKGKYTAVYDMKDYLNQGLNNMITVDSCNVEFYLDIKDGNKYTLYTDENQIKEATTDALSKALGDLVSKDDIKKLIDQMDTTSINQSHDGTYKVDGDKITFTSDDGETQDATIGKDGSITMSDTSGTETIELVFKK